MSTRTLVLPPKIGEIGLIRAFPTLSIFNPYIPLKAIMDGEIISHEQVSKRILHYTYTESTNCYNARIYDEFFDRLYTPVSGLGYYPHKLVKPGLRNIFYASVGQLSTYLPTTENGVATRSIFPLITLTVKHEYLWRVIDGILYDRPLNPEHLCLIVSKELVNGLEKDMSDMYRNVKRAYIDVLGDQFGIDIFYTNSIVDNCFNQKGFALPQFKSLVELSEHTKQVNDDLQSILRVEQDKLDEQRRLAEARAAERNQRLREVLEANRQLGGQISTSSGTVSGISGISNSTGSYTVTVTDARGPIFLDATTGQFTRGEGEPDGVVAEARAEAVITEEDVWGEEREEDYDPTRDIEGADELESDSTGEDAPLTNTDRDTWI